MLAAEPPSYLLPYLAAAQRYGAGFGTLLWASPRSQAARFKALLRAVDPTGKVIIDVGCGRADFLEFLLRNSAVPKSYVGLEAVEDLAAAAESKRLPNCTIVRGDFCQNPNVLAANGDVLFYSGSLNTMSEENFYTCLRAGFDSARQAVVFNFLATPGIAAAPYLTWHQPNDVLAFARTLSNRTALWDDYLPGDVTVAIWKDQL